MAAFLEIICSIFTIVFYLSLFIPFQKLNNESIGFQDSPYILLIMSFCNSILNGIYYLRNDLDILWISHFLCSFISFIFIVILLIFISEQKIVKSLLFNIISLIVIILIFYICYSLLNINSIKVIGIIFKILMYAALNEKLHNFIKTKISDLLPIVSSIIGLISAIFWSIYGFLESKSDFTIPNLFGILFTALPISLWYLIKENKNDSENESSSERESSDNSNQNIIN